MIDGISSELECFPDRLIHFLHVHEPTPENILIHCTTDSGVRLDVICELRDRLRELGLFFHEEKIIRDKNPLRRKE